MVAAAAPTPSRAVPVLMMRLGDEGSLDDLRSGATGQEDKVKAKSRCQNIDYIEFLIDYNTLILCTNEQIVLRLQDMEKRYIQLKNKWR
jgi:hypothetical protein